MPEIIRLRHADTAHGLTHARQEIREKLACAKATNASKRQTTGFCYMIGVQGYAE
jgi:hypothetical protein